MRLKASSCFTTVVFKSGRYIEKVRIKDVDFDLATSELSATVIRAMTGSPEDSDIQRLVHDWNDIETFTIRDSTCATKLAPHLPVASLVLTIARTGHSKPVTGSRVTLTDVVLSC